MYLTPDTPPGDNVWLLFHVPRDSRHIGLFVGALADLCNEYHFVREGTFSPADTAEEFCRILRDMIYYHPVEVGSYVWSIRDTAPSNWIKMDGSYYNYADWPELVPYLPEFWRIDDDQFVAPDIAGRSLIGDGTYYQSEGAGYIFNAHHLGGERLHNLTVDELAVHTHGESVAVPVTIPGGLEVPVPSATASSGVTGSAGAGLGHNNMPPYLVAYLYLVGKFVP